jgi:hypothetical protein
MLYSPPQQFSPPREWNLCREYRYQDFLDIKGITSNFKIREEMNSTGLPVTENWKIATCLDREFWERMGNTTVIVDGNSYVQVEE